MKAVTDSPLRTTPQFHLARPAAMTKLSADKTVKTIRCMGGNLKFRALRLDHGTFSWGTEVVGRKTRILDVVYNATNNELVRTNTLTKGTIVSVDATPFRDWYFQHYGEDLSKSGTDVIKANEDKKLSSHAQRKRKQRAAKASLAQDLKDQFKGNRLLACISSRPGQSGRGDGYILEGEELAFYQRKLNTKKAKK